MNWKHFALLGALASWGCGEDTPAAATSGSGGAGGSCWYCVGGAAGVGGAGTATSGKSTTKGAGGGKDSVTVTFAGQLNMSTGEGSFRYRAAQDVGEIEICDVTYTVTGATADATCMDCTFAFALPLSAPKVVVGDECSGQDMLEGESPSWGHKDPSTLMVEKNGSWTPLDAGGKSDVMGDEWTFSFVYVAGGGKGEK